MYTMSVRQITTKEYGRKKKDVNLYDNDACRNTVNHIWKTAKAIKCENKYKQSVTYRWNDKMKLSTTYSYYEQFTTRHLRAQAATK